MLKGTENQGLSFFEGMGDFLNLERNEKNIYFR